MTVYIICAIIQYAHANVIRRSQMSEVFQTDATPIKMLNDYIMSMWPVIPTELLEFYMMAKKDEVLFQDPKNGGGDHIVFVRRNTSRPEKQTTDNQYVYYKDVAIVSYNCKYYPEPDRIKAKWHTRSFLEKILRICDLSDKGIEFVYLIGMIEDDNVGDSRRTYDNQNESELKIYVGLEYTLFKPRVA